MTSRVLGAPTTAEAAPATKGAVNRLLIAVLEAPSGRWLGRRLAVVEYAGRRSGRRHRLVVQYVVVGSRVLMRAGRPRHKTWWRNFEGGHPLLLRLAGVDHTAFARVVRDRGRVSVVAELEPVVGTSTGPAPGDVRGVLA